MSDRPSLPRRDFLAGSLAAAATAGLAAQLQAAETAAGGSPQEFYELRIYRNTDSENFAAVSEYLESALLPALSRRKIDRVGVFQALSDPQDQSLYVLIPYASLEVLATLNDSLAADQAYQQSAAEFFARPIKTPAYTRQESRLMKAFAGMPVIELPAQTKAKADRIFELRIYESHNAHKARLKVEMFNKGEIDIMRDCQMAPVFYGETLISNDVPNLTYMLSASDEEAHNEHWQAFRTHPEWDRMKKLERYKDTVSKIISVKLKPTAYSQI